MKRYLYCYNTIVSFSEPVGNHEFLIRCQPVLGEYMSVEEAFDLSNEEYKQKVTKYINKMIKI